MTGGRWLSMHGDFPPRFTISRRGPLVNGPSPSAVAQRRSESVRRSASCSSGPRFHLRTRSASLTQLRRDCKSAPGGNGTEPARTNFARSASRISKRLDRDAPAIPEKVFVKQMRDLFNWLRHADYPSDSDTATWDLEEEAEQILSRAIEYMGQLLADYPLRAEEFVAVMRARSQRRGAAS